MVYCTIYCCVVSATQQREPAVSIHPFYFLTQLCDMSLPLGFNSTLYIGTTQNQNPPLSPQLLRSRALRSRVAPLAWLPYPLCPYPPGPRGSPRPTWPPPPKGGGISGVARDVATCAAEAACVRVGGGSFGREEGGARQAVTSPLSHSHRPLP